MVAHRTLTTLAIMMPSASKCFQSKLSIMFNAIEKKTFYFRKNGNSCWEVEDDGLDHDHDNEGHTLFRVSSR